LEKHLALSPTAYITQIGRNPGRRGKNVGFSLSSLPSFYSIVRRLLNRPAHKGSSFRQREKKEANGGTAQHRAQILAHQVKLKLLRPPFKLDFKGFKLWN